MNTIFKRTIFIFLSVLCSVCAWAQVGDTAIPSVPFSEPEMVFVQGGTFTMGCAPERGNDCMGNDEPAHRVTLSDFFIGKYEVTQAQWEAVMGAGNNPSRFKGGNLPVENVNWDDSQEFIKRLNALTGKKWRLPTEAEWEYAARGGSQSRGYKYSGSDDIEDVAWYDANSANMTHPVGTKKANELGIYDMSGNVWEWIHDWNGSYIGNAQTNPNGPASGMFRVVRGGSWGRYSRLAVVSSRYSFNPGDRGGTLGFRLAYSSN